MVSMGDAWRPTVSVVIPTYNRLEDVRRALRSVQAQTFQDFEIIIVDDGSSEALQPLEGQFAKTRVIRHATNQGAASARNTGVSAARGEYTAFLDSDDEWLPTKLAQQLAILQVRPDLGACTTGFINLTPQGRVLDIPARQADWYRHLAKGCGLSPGSTLLARTALLVEFPYDPTFPRQEDMDLLLRFTRRYTLDVVREPLALIHLGRQPSLDLVERANLRMLEKHGADFRALGWFYGRQCTGKRCLEVAVHAYGAGDRVKGRTYLLRAVRANPFQRPGMYLRILDAVLGTALGSRLKSFLSRISRRGA